MNSKYLHVALAVTAVTILVGSPIVGAAEMDGRTEDTIKESYVFKTYLKDNKVDVVSQEGVVTLKGTVEDDNERNLAQNTAESVPGVIRVDNQLQLKDELPAENSDGWISVKVKAVLLVNRNVSGTETRVFVKDGIVTLEGEASSEAQKELTAEYAKDIEGVKNVVNKINVVKDEKVAKKQADNNMMEVIDDASITAQVKGALFTHRSTSAIKTKVETKDGIVTLKGNARNEAEKALVTKLVTDIKGVKGVDNKMDVI